MLFRSVDIVVKYFAYDFDAKARLRFQRLEQFFFSVDYCYVIYEMLTSYDELDKECSVPTSKANRRLPRASLAGRRKRLSTARSKNASGFKPNGPTHSEHGVHTNANAVQICASDASAWMLRGRPA